VNTGTRWVLPPRDKLVPFRNATANATQPARRNKQTMRRPIGALLLLLGTLFVVGGFVTAVCGDPTTLVVTTSLSSASCTRDWPLSRRARLAACSPPVTSSA
jgi:hypothetical protein